MYKNRITQWGLHKNGPRSIKPGPTLNPQRPLSATTVIERVEVLLWHTSAYSRSWREERVDFPWKYNKTSRKWAAKMAQSTALISFSNAMKGMQTIDEACDIIKQAMSLGYSDLLPHLFTVFCYSWWNEKPDLRIQLLRFLTKLAATKYGGRHPVTVVLFHMQDSEVLTACLRAFEIWIATAEEDMPLMHTTAWGLRNSYCCMLLDMKDFENADHHAFLLLKHSEKWYGRASWFARSALLRRGDVEYDRGDWSAACCYYAESRDLARDYYHHEYPDYIAVEAHASLALACMQQGLFSKAQETCCAALHNQTKPLYGVTNRMALTLRSGLEKTLDRIRLQSTEGQSPRSGGFGGGGGGGVGRSPYQKPPVRGS